MLENDHVTDHDRIVGEGGGEEELDGGIASQVKC